jgi:RNA polymerase sigma-32 factor
MAEVQRHPTLSPEEELKVAERYYKYRKVEDAHKLVTSNLRYVVKVAIKFNGYGCRLADLIQEGNIGLMVAVKKFDPYKGFRLITYATWWIKSFIQDFIVKTRGLVKQGAKSLKKRLFYKNGDDGRPAPQPDLSLDKLVADEKTTHLDLLSDTGPTQEENFAAMEEAANVKSGITDALVVLSERERIVIKDRVMAEEPESLQALGDRLGLTRERVRQIQGTALKKLKKALSLKGPLMDVLPERSG